MNDVVTNETHVEVQRYYGETLSSSDDLKTTACCTTAAMPDFAKRYLAEIHDEVLRRYYGCGLVLPEQLEGMSILDLGCGAGRDVYLLSRLTGSAGRVVGVDMTPEQLAVAREHQDYHAEIFGYPKSNVSFIEANIERLDEAGLQPGSFDLIVSNCVINLAVDKAAVLNSAKRLLRPGGEMYFADIYVDRRIPEQLKSDPVLYGECLAGAMYPADFVRLAQAAGFNSPRLVESTGVDITDPEVQQRTGSMRFTSATYRLFNINELEATEENYGQRATYLGTIPEHPDVFVLDHEQRFPAGEEIAISGNTARILQASRFATSFRLIGDQGPHLGTFSDNSGHFPDFSSPASQSTGSCC